MTDLYWIIEGGQRGFYIVSQNRLLTYDEAIKHISKYRTLDTKDKIVSPVHYLVKVGEIVEKFDLEERLHDPNFDVNDPPAPFSKKEIEIFMSKGVKDV